MQFIQMDHAMLSMLAKKARHGQPCTSCGLCCSASLCEMAAAVFDKPPRSAGPCPALEWKDGKSSCGMVNNPTKYSARAIAVGHDIAVKAAVIMIDPGAGCDMAMPGDRDLAYMKRRDDGDRQRTPQIAWAARVWDFRSWIKKHFIRRAA